MSKQAEAHADHAQKRPAPDPEHLAIALQEADPFSPLPAGPTPISPEQSPLQANFPVRPPPLQTTFPVRQGPPYGPLPSPFTAAPTRPLPRPPTPATAGRTHAGLHSRVPQLPPIPRLPPLTVPLLPVPADPELIRFRRATFNATPSATTLPPQQRAGTARNCLCLRCNPPPDHYHRQLHAFMAPPARHQDEQNWHQWQQQHQPQPATPPPRDPPPPLSPSSSFFTATDSEDSDSEDQEAEDAYHHHPLSFPPRSLSLDSGRAAAAAAAHPAVSSSSTLVGVGGAFQQIRPQYYHQRRWDGVILVETGPWSQPVSVFETDSSDDEDGDEEDGYGEDETGLDSDDEAELLALAM